MTPKTPVEHMLIMDRFAREAVHEFDNTLQILALSSIEPRVLPLAIIPAVAEAIAVVRMNLEIIKNDDGKNKPIIT